MIKLDILLFTCCLLIAFARGNISLTEHNGLVPSSVIGLPTSNSSSSSSSIANKLESNGVKKSAAVKFQNAYGDEGETLSFEEFRDTHQKMLRRDNEMQEEMLRMEEEERKRMRSFCFHVPEEFCELKNFTAELAPERDGRTPLCPCKKHPFVTNSIICCNLTSIDQAKQCLDLKEMGHNIHLHIRNATMKELNLNNSWWRNFDRISITDGSVSKLTKSLPRNENSLKCLNVSNNHLTSIDPRIFSTLTKLTVFDVSQNNLTQLPNLKHVHNLTLNIRGNKLILCRVVQEAMQTLNFTERNRSKCASNHTFQWFNMTDFIPISQLYVSQKLENICPKPCTCHVNRWKYDDASEVPQAFYTVRVDCSNKGLIELPLKLPDNTFFLNVSNNNITSLEGLNRHETLVRLYADNNQISNLLGLEGTAFKEDFEVLSLRNNKLKQIPIYLLTKTLDKSPRGKALFFAGNKLNCDCNSAKELRIWLLGHQNSIKDYDLIMCENMAENVTQLSEAKLCQSKHDAMDYIVYLIALEVLLLLALIFKVSYDYYVFKTQSYLPWPANKMPKLPCDWLCESG